MLRAMPKPLDPMQLAAEVLHEVRQPLLGIKGYLQVHAEAPDRPLPVSLLLAQVERIERIIGDFTRLSSQRPATKERLPLGKVVQEAAALFGQGAEAARCDVDLDLAPGVEVNGNERLLAQLVLNLLLNAREALGGRGRIKVWVGREQTQPSLYVADWGPGIAPELRDQLFEPYATTRGRGSGLGLAVCRRICEEHGAQIDLAPPSVLAEQPPPATVFRVRFPAEAEAERYRRRLLVVDDESVIRRIFSDLMSKECEVTEAETAEQALRLLREERFDLIVTDKNLPGRSGLELAQEARRLDPASRVMMMTGYPSLVTAQQALELGLVDYLLKPFDDIREVREKIRTALVAPRQPTERALGRRVEIYEDDEEIAAQLAEAVRETGFDAEVLAAPGPPGPVPPAGVVVSWEYGPAAGRAALELARTAAQGAPFVVIVEHLSMETTLEALRGGAAACIPKLTGDVKALGREFARALRLGGT
jgi:DNA-binding response OmpR family regulator